MVQMLPLPFIRRRRRRTAGLPPLVMTAVEGIAPIGGGDIEMELVFDTTAEAPLAEVGSSETAKWSARYQGVRYVGGLMNIIAFNRLSMIMGPTGPEPGPDQISYAHNPSDIADVNGRELAAFSGLPM